MQMRPSPHPRSYKTFVPSRFMDNEQHERGSAGDLILLATHEKHIVDVGMCCNCVLPRTYFSVGLSCRKETCVKNDGS